MSLLVTAGEDIRLWSLPELSFNSVRNGTNANVLHCTCSPNGQLVAYTYDEAGIRVCSLMDEDLPIIEIPTPIQQSSVGFNGHSRYLVTGGLDCVINIWDIKTRTVKRTYKNHSNPITYCQFNYNDNVIASSSDHGDILLTNVSTGEASEPLTGNDDSQAVRCLGYSHFSRSLLGSVSDSGAVCLWDTKERKILKKFQDHKAPGTCLSFSPLNDMLLCSSGLDKRIIFYDVTGKKTVKTINTESPITSCDFLSDGCTVAAGSASGHAYLFDLRHGSTPIKVVSAHKTSVRSVAFQRIPKESKSPKKPLEGDGLSKTTRSSNNSSSLIGGNRRLSSSSDTDISNPITNVGASGPFSLAHNRVQQQQPQQNAARVEPNLRTTPASAVERVANDASMSRENSSTNLRSVDNNRKSMFDVQVTPTREPTSNNNAVDGRPPLPGKSKSGQQFYQSQQPQPHDSVNTPHTPIAFNNFGGSLQNIHQSSSNNPPSMVGMRENSTMALNRMINMNHTPEQMAALSAIPPKAAKLMGDEIFSPIATDVDIKSSTLPRKLKASKQKSLGRNQHAVNKNHDSEDPERPSYGRSKSGLSRLSMLAKSTEDLSHSVKKDKKEKDLEGHDLHDGKRTGSGLLGFKSPFKKGKKNTPVYNKHSDESETSSIDSYSLEDKTSLRSKKDRLSNRSNDSAMSRHSAGSGGVLSTAGSHPATLSGTASGGPALPYSLDQPIDTNQLMNDIQNSLASSAPSNTNHHINSQQHADLTRSPSGGGHPEAMEYRLSNPPSASIVNGDIFQYDNNAEQFISSLSNAQQNSHHHAMGGGRPPQIQVDFIQKMIDEAMEENRSLLHNDMVNLQVEMLRQMEIQKEQIRHMMQETSINGDLLLEIERLRLENEKLRFKY